ncbi:MULTISPECIES: DUF503 domain-containing protein [Clostridium]|uniref:DUF503 domain-containing protein n=1 Tax=Clostridium TaxID=1485 RepID=UPI0018842183|nr:MULTISPECIES: DUF503 domain-containing protein [Clostridium]MCR6515712.1 DUF503 domain-containing protein [Clostridium sp. LY3-2]
MDVLIMKITIRNSFVKSLKEKRMIRLSIIGRLKNKFNISISEIGYLDDHKLMQLGIAGAFSDVKVLHSAKEKIIDFVESNIEGEIIDIEEIAEIF